MCQLKRKFPERNTCQLKKNGGSSSLVCKWEKSSHGRESFASCELEQTSAATHVNLEGNEMSVKNPWKGYHHCHYIINIIIYNTKVYQINSYLVTSGGCSLQVMFTESALIWYVWIYCIYISVYFLRALESLIVHKTSHARYVLWWSPHNQNSIQTILKKWRDRDLVTCLVPITWWKPLLVQTNLLHSQMLHKWFSRWQGSDRSPRFVSSASNECTLWWVIVLLYYLSQYALLNSWTTCIIFVRFCPSLM